MKIQLIYFPDCPNVEAARTAVREALAADQLDAPIEEIDVSRADAPSWAKGWGSPTVLVDGVDVAGGLASPDEAYCCRLYQGGAPSVAQLRERFTRPTPRTVTTADTARWRLPVIGGIATALAASACCVVPVVLAIVGVSGAGIASSLVPLRPYFLTATALALAAGFWFAYRGERAVDACGCAVPRRRRWSRLGLWLGTALTLGIAGYPLVADGGASVAVRARGVAEIRLHITGMDCAACAKPLAARLARVAGVATVDVDYDHALAVVTHDGRRDPTAELLEAIADLEYQAAVAP